MFTAPRVIWFTWILCGASSSATGGHIELAFRDESDLSSARDLLAGYNAAIDMENLSLTVITDGSAKQMADILSRIEGAGITITEFAQKLPTLEDVFLTIIGENNEKEVS